MPTLDVLLGFCRKFLGRGVSSRASHNRSARDGTQLNPSTSQSPRRERSKATLNRVVDVLGTTKELSSACEPLELAISALLVVLKAFKNYIDAMEALENLLARLESLRAMLEERKQAGYANCPQTFKERLDIFASKMQSVVDQAEALQSQQRVVRFINASDYQEKIEDWIKKLSWHVQSFILEGTIALELTVYETAAEVRQVSKQMGERFDQVDNGIADVRSDISQLKTDDTIPGLRYAPRARFDFGRSGRSQCDPGTRDEVLKTIYAWLRPEDRDLKRLHELLPSLELLPDSSILWIYALAGAGKTTVAETVAAWCHERDCLGSSFFCARDGDRSDVQCIVQNIASDLAHYCPEFREALLAAVKDNPHIRTASVSQQAKILLAEPVQAANRKGASWKRRVIVIDALDECKDGSAESTFLHALSIYIKELAPLLFLITSRPVPNITRGFRFLEELGKRTQELPLDRVPTEYTDRDIGIFLRARFADIGLRHAGAGPHWVSEEQVLRVVKLAERLFIYATTVTSFIEDPKVIDPQRQLDILLRSVYGRSKTAASGAPEARLVALDELYEQVLHAFFEDPSTALQARLKRVLGTIVLAEERLRPSGLSALLGEDLGSVLDVIERLRSVLSFSSEGDTYTEIRLIHLSFADFLVDPKRCKTHSFLVTPSIQHSFIALRCLKVMQESLESNICKVPSEHDHLLNHDIPGLAARISRCLPFALQYACRYCLHHMGLADIGEELLSALKEFCNTHLLHWLEALSLMGCVDRAAESLRSTQLYLRQRCPQATEVLSLLYDCERMVRAFYPAISGSFMQVYGTAVPFSPTDSPLRRIHQEDHSGLVEVRMGLEKAWSSTLASRVTGAARVSALAFSPDGTHVACGAHDGSIQLLNTHTAAQRQSFKGHTDCIDYVSFSPTGKEILSGSYDHTARLWDVATGACLHTWEGHSDWVRSVAWSLDGALVASGSDDGSVIIRMVTATPEKMAVLRHNNWVCDVAFAADGTLVSGSEDRTCKVWDTKQLDWDDADHTPSHTLKHDQEVRTVVVSPDSCVVACGLEYGEIVLWRKSDGQRLRSLHGESDVISLAFYSDSRLPAAYAYSPFILWDVSTATPLDTVDNERAYAAAFSPDGVHIAHAHDDTVQILRWSGNAPREFKSKKATAFPSAVRVKRWLHSHLPGFRSIPVMEEHADDLVTDVKAVAVSPAGALILAVFNEEWRLWDVSNGRWIRTGEYAGLGNIVAWSPSGNLFACTDRDDVIRVWEVQTGKLVESFAGHSKEVKAVVFTADEQHLLSASSDGSIRRWKVRKTPQETSCDVLFQSDGDKMEALAVSTDGQWMLSGSYQRGSPPDTSSADLLAKPSRPPVRYHAWLCALRLHDATGRVVWIEHHPSFVTSLAFSEDCTRALVGNHEGKLFLYDLTQLIPPDKYAPRSPPPLAVPEYRFSSGSTRPTLHVSFAPGDEGIITERSYTSLSPDLQPLSRRTIDASLLPTYFVDDHGWLWRVNPTLSPHRICWLSLSFRPTGPEVTRAWRSQHGYGIACLSPEGRLVVIDTSQAL